MALVVRASATHLACVDDLTKSSGPWGLEPLIDVEELAEYLGVPVTTIYDWRTNGKGPPAHRFGKRLKFAVSDVRAWLAAQREPGAR